MTAFQLGAPCAEYEDRLLLLYEDLVQLHALHACDLEACDTSDHCTALTNAINDAVDERYPEDEAAHWIARWPGFLDWVCEGGFHVVRQFLIGAIRQDAWEERLYPNHATQPVHPHTTFERSYV